MYVSICVCLIYGSLRSAHTHSQQSPIDRRALHTRIVQVLVNSISIYKLCMIVCV